MHTPEPFHAVRFYDDEAALCRLAADFVADGFNAGEPAFVVATRPHVEQIRRVLISKSFDLAALTRRGEMVVLDVECTLAQFMKGGSPDPGAFRAHVGGAIERLLAGRCGRRARAYGEMVDWLWKHAAPDAAIRLEVLWNQLATQCAFSLLCAYSLGTFFKHGAYDRICAEHTHVMSDAGELTPTAGK